MYKYGYDRLKPRHKSNKTRIYMNVPVAELTNFHIDLYVEGAHSIDGPWGNDCNVQGPRRLVAGAHSIPNNVREYGYSYCTVLGISSEKDGYAAGAWSPDSKYQYSVMPLI